MMAAKSAGNNFAAMDFQCKMPSFDAQARQRKWRDAISNALKDNQYELDEVAHKLARGFLAHATGLPLEAEKIRNFIWSSVLKADDGYFAARDKLDEVCHFLVRVRDDAFTPEEWKSPEKKKVHRIHSQVREARV